MTRAFCIPGIVFLTCALVLLVLVSISLPFLTGLDFVRVHFSGNSLGTQDEDTIDQLRVRFFEPACFRCN